MSSSTVACTTHRLLLAAPVLPAHRPYRWSAQGRSAAAQRRPWLERLRRALEEDLFVLHYQPIVSLSDGEVAHYEALVRLADEPEGRLIAPARFLPAAERYGLITEIDRMVLEKVAAMLGSGGGESGAGVAMNLSALSVTEDGMLSDIQRALERHGADPARLVVELTETAAISDMKRASAFCAGVHELGSSIALDDFGAGFGSFGYLKRLPFRYLKIDGDFIRGLPGSPTDQLVVKALVAVVHGMGSQAIAEFVGDEATVGLLRRYGVDFAQGFHVGHPRPLVELTASG
jgi:EAL domain-containing protein (putative c-di-GMP-specific phosphodiesterase class I)